MRVQSPIPDRLVKYVPSRYVKAVLSGDLLFRNLAYFRRVEDAARGDVAEGMHIDSPGKPVSLSDAKTGVVKSVGFFRFHNEIDQEHVFAFCLAQRLDPALFEEFGCDTAIEILDVRNFLDRVSRAIQKSPIFAKSGLIGRPVEYYHPRLQPLGDIKDPYQIPFFKPIQFEAQNEYRLVASHRKGLVLRESIVRGNHSLAEEAAKMVPLERVFRVGNLSKFTRVIEKGSR